MRTRWLVTLFLLSYALIGCRTNTTYKIPTKQYTLEVREADPTEQQEFEKSYRDFADFSAETFLIPNETQIIPVLSGYQTFLTFLGASEGQTYSQLSQIVRTLAPDEYSLVQGFNGLIRYHNLEKNPQEKTSVQFGSSTWMIWPIIVEQPFAEETARRIRSDVVRLGSTGITAQNTIQDWLDQFIPLTQARKPGLTRENPIINLGVTQITADFHIQMSPNTENPFWFGRSSANDDRLQFIAYPTGQRPENIKPFQIVNSDQSTKSEINLTSTTDFTKLIDAIGPNELATGPIDLRNMSIDLIPQADPVGIKQIRHTATIKLFITGENPFAQPESITFEIQSSETRLPLIIGTHKQK